MEVREQKSEKARFEPGSAVEVREGSVLDMGLDTSEGPGWTWILPDNINNRKLAG